MSESAALASLIGVNIGTTITLHLVALKLSKFAYMFLSLSFFVKVLGIKKLRGLDGALFGFGLMFVGNSLIGSSAKEIAAFPAVSSALVSPTALLRHRCCVSAVLLAGYSRP